MCDIAAEYEVDGPMQLAVESMEFVYKTAAHHSIGTRILLRREIVLVMYAPLHRNHATRL
jgi:hypothetical protein